MEHGIGIGWFKGRVGPYVVNNNLIPIIVSSGSICVDIPPTPNHSGSREFQSGESISCLKRAAPNLNVPSIIFECETSKGVERAKVKAEAYLNNPGILMVISTVYWRKVNGLFKAVAIVYDRAVSITHPSIIISFGTLPTSIRNENKYNSFFNGIVTTGILSNGLTPQIVANNPMFTIRVPSAYITDCFVPPLLQPSPDLILNLFTANAYMDQIL